VANTRNTRHAGTQIGRGVTCLVKGQLLRNRTLLKEALLESGKMTEYSVQGFVMDLV